MLIKWSVPEDFDYSINKNEEGFMWVILKQKLNICVCYLPPVNSSDRLIQTNTLQN